MTKWQQYVSEFHGALGEPSGGPLTAKILAMRRSLIDEEAAEIRTKGIERRDLVEVYDALCDLAYVLLGSFDQAGKVASGRYVELLNTTRWRRPKFPGPQLVDSYRGALEFTIARAGMATLFMGQCLQQGCEFKRWDLLDDTMCAVVHTAGDLGFDIHPLFDEVHMTNLAKVGGPRDPVTGKRLKPTGWTPPDLRRLLVEQGAVL